MGEADRLYHSAEHRRHGVNIRFPTDPHGELIWASPASPGSVHDPTAARVHGIVDGLTCRAIACHADGVSSDGHAVQPASSPLGLGVAGSRQFADVAGGEGVIYGAPHEKYGIRHD